MCLPSSKLHNCHSNPGILRERTPVRNKCGRGTGQTVVGHSVATLRAPSGDGNLKHRIEVQGKRVTRGAAGLAVPVVQDQGG